MGSSAYLQAGSSPTTNTVGEFGNYTFNINGTLDMRSTGTSCIVAHSTLVNTTTINVNGTWLLGNAIRFITTTTTAPAGSIVLNIGTNGVVDAGSRTIGSSNTATNMVVTNSTIGQTAFFNITDGGMLKNKVSTTDVLYPIGSNNTYSPVKLNNSGTADIIGVGVKSSIDYSVGDNTKVVNKQFRVVPATTGVVNLAISLGWLVADQGASFSPSAATVLGKYTGSAWIETAATVSGAGTITSPYYAKASGYTTFAPFVVSNSTALPLNLLSFSAVKNNNSVTVAWATSNEINVNKFEVERSTDGRNFIKAGTVIANNNSGNKQYYDFMDFNIFSTVVYYRLRIVDNNGYYRYSNIVSVNNRQIGLLSVYPNPANSSMVVNHPVAGKNSGITVYNAAGNQVMYIDVPESSKQTSLNISNLATGEYILMFNNGSNCMVKFIKQ